MLASLIKIQVVDKLRAETVFRKHAFNGHPDKLRRFLLHDFLRCSETLSTRISGVTDIHLVSHLVSGEPDLVRIDDDDIVTAVHVRSIARLVLAAKDKRYSGSKTAEHQVGGINENPPRTRSVASMRTHSFLISPALSDTVL